jgi:hypothetical protein
MSALGQKRTFRTAIGHVRFTPKSDMIAFFGVSALGHVWTARGWQELFSALVGAAMCSAF